MRKDLIFKTIDPSEPFRSALEQTLKEGARQGNCMKIFLTAPSERKRSIAKPIFVQDWFPFETIPLSHMVKEISSCNFPEEPGSCCGKPLRTKCKNS